MSDNLYRKLPAVNDVLADPALVGLESQLGRDQLVASVRHQLEDLRRRLPGGSVTVDELTPLSVASRVAASLDQQFRPKLVGVINATGIVLHTNLGRAPIADAASRAAAGAASGYLNLELDLDTGKRSSRQSAIREWVCRLTGAESATAVNNNAAATVIVLRAIALGKEVILSRGQLIEIGGSFRIPDIMGVSGAILREVGTTNITRLADFEKALSPNTGALMQIHTSNYRIGGFTRAVTLAELVALGRKHHLPVIDDAGSGALIDFHRFALGGEPVIRQSIAAGADLVLFSGDKLLGGPQAGIIAGKKEWIQKIEKDPLMRAFRLDKMTLAALEVTLRIYLNEEKALREVPVLRMLGMPLEELRTRCVGLAERMRRLPGVSEARVREDHAYVGGGSLPDQKLPTWVIEVVGENVRDAALAMRLRAGSPAVMARVRDGVVVLDLRTVFPAQEEDLLGAVGQGVTP